MEENGVGKFALSISSDDAPSRARAAKLGFAKVGSHFDETDGTKDVFLRILA